MNQKQAMLYIFAGGLVMSLAACSYAFDTFSYLRNGQLYFDLRPKQQLPMFGADVNCIKEIMVEEKDRKPVETLLPDGSKKLLYPEVVVWHYGDRLARDCVLSFPVRYGNAKNKKLERVEANSLRNNVAYSLTIFSSGSGYGGHHFRMKNMIGTVDLPPP